MGRKAPPKRRIKTRDYLMVRVISGVTKAAVHVDRRKKASRNACRDWKKGKA